ncbi:hypothetical protein D3C74_335870 [compost metagenome]
MGPLQYQFNQLRVEAKISANLNLNVWMRRCKFCGHFINTLDQYTCEQEIRHDDDFLRAQQETAF